MINTYDVTCPLCEEEFEVEIDPLTEEESIECPECLDEIDWEYDAEADAITLMPYADDDEDEDSTPLVEEDDEEDNELA